MRVDRNDEYGDEITTTSFDALTNTFTPLVEVGSVLVSMPTPDPCQALERQYWHRVVVLITRVSDNAAFGNVDDSVPEDQLAWGGEARTVGISRTAVERGISLCHRSFAFVGK